MTDFRIFPLDKSGHVSGRDDVTCPTAEEAFSLAAKLLKPDFPAAEIWLGQIRLGRVCAHWFLDTDGSKSSSIRMSVDYEFTPAARMRYGSEA